jgi:hypothetical protein
MIDKDSLPLDKPRRTPDHPTKSHVVKTRVDGKEKIIRFGEQGASTAGKPKEGESDAMKQKRASFKARHAKNIAKGKSSPAFWADKVKWKTGGAVGLEELNEKYEGIKKPDFSLLESFQDLIRTLQERAADAGTQEFDPVRALGRSGAAGGLEDLYEAYSGKPAPHASRVEAGAKDPKRTETAKMVFDSFKNAGFSDAQAKALTAEINREGSFNPAYLYGSHTDAANKATNVGMLSWQGDRADRLMSFMADRGLIDPAGRIVPGQEALNAQAMYLRDEMENDPSYARTRETFLGNPNIDPDAAHDILGKNFIRWRIDDPKYRGSGFDRISEGYDILNMAQGFAEGGLAELTQKYAPGGDVKKGDNPYDILNLEPDAFVGALDELGMQGDERKFLMDQYFAKNRALPMTDRPEGKTVRTILPIATPEGMSGYEALMSGDFEFTVPEILRGIYESPAEAINVASAIGRGVPVTEAQVQEAGMAVPELMAGVAPARAITIGGGRIGALDYDPTVMRAFTGPGEAYERKGADIAERLRGTRSVGDVLGLEPAPAGAGFTEIGSKQPRILGEHTSTGIMSDELEAPEQQTFSGLIGRDILSIVGDNTGRHIVTGVKEKTLENPVKSMAGFEYIDVPGQGYAGAQSAQSGKLNEALASQDPYLISVMMAEKSGDFARHTGNVYGEMAKFAEIASKDVEKVDEAIRNISQPIKRKVVMPDGSVKMVGETIKPFTDFPSVKDPSAILNYINSLPTGTQRAYFLKGLDRAMFEKAGLPSVADARLAVADARQLGMDWGATGYRGFTPDIEKGLLKTTPEQSTTYDTGIDKLGKSQTLIGEGMGIPANLVFRDLAAAMRAKGTGGKLAMTSPDYKVYESSPKRAKQRVDMKLADMLDTFLEIERRYGREPAMRYAGDLLSGDQITSDMITAARREYAPGFAEGGSIEDLDQKYAEGGSVNSDDELQRAILLRDLDMMAQERSPNAVPAQGPSLMNVGGIGDRLALVNKYLNPVEAIGEAMRAGSRLTSADASGYDRLAALGDMLSGVAGVAGPAAVAKRVGTPAAAAVMEGLTGGAPAANAAPFGKDWSDVYHWSRSPDDFSEFDLSQSKSAMSQLGPHVGTPQAAEARYMGFAKPEGVPPALGFTLPMKADLSKPFLNPVTGKPWTEMDLEMFISAVSDTNSMDRRLVAPFIRERLAKEGYTSIPYMNDVEDAGSVSHIMLADRPTGSDAVLRSRFAKFDPAMRASKNISAGAAVGAAGLGASQYDPDAIETRASKAGKNEFAAGGAVKYDPSAVDRIINQLREVNRG